MDFLRSFLRRHLAGKPVVPSPNIGCFLMLIDGQFKTVSLSQFKSKLKQQYLSVYLFWANTLFFVTSILLSSFFIKIPASVCA